MPRLIDKNVFPIPCPTPGFGISFDWPDDPATWPPEARWPIPDDWVIVWANRPGCYGGDNGWFTWPPPAEVDPVRETTP